MNAPVLTFFNTKAGVGKTSLVYHLAWMYATLGKRVVVLDLDPQAYLTTEFLTEETVTEIWNSGKAGSTISRCLNLVSGDAEEPTLHEIATDLYLLPGDIALSAYEEIFAAEWARESADGLAAVRSLWQAMQKAAKQVEADIVLVDTAPNSGAINRSVLAATDYVAIPLRADLLALAALKYCGKTLRNWKQAWQKRSESVAMVKNGKGPDGPVGRMEPIGYLCWQPSPRPQTLFLNLMDDISSVFRRFVLDEPSHVPVEIEEDPYLLGVVKEYRSLIMMGHEKRKPIFSLTPADGAIGSHAGAVQDARKDYKKLAETIAGRIALQL